jgi:hypothetical protein
MYNFFLHFYENFSTNHQPIIKLKFMKQIVIFAACMLFASLITKFQFSLFFRLCIFKSEGGISHSLSRNSLTSSQQICI